MASQDLPENLRPQLREYLLIILGPVQAEMREQRAAIQELASGLISQERIETLKFQVANLSEQIVTLERKLHRAERYMLIYLFTSWTFLIVLLTIAIVQWLQGPNLQK